MLSAKSDVQVDTAEVRVTEWRLAPGSATGHHIHEMDYVIVPVTSGEMTIVAPGGERVSAAGLAGGRRRANGLATRFSAGSRADPRVRWCPADHRRDLLALAGRGRTGRTDAVQRATVAGHG